MTASPALRLAGFGMVLGGVLFFTRMAPIFPLVPEDMAFPPSSTKDLVRLAALAGDLWPLSHCMGLVAVLLFIIGYWVHAGVLNAGKRDTVATAAAIIASLSFGAFAVALIIDGFLLYASAQAYSAGGADAPDLIKVQAVHDRALLFFTPGVFGMFVAVGLLSSRLVHGLIHSRWLGVLGQLIAITATVAYLYGGTGPNWDKLQIGGSLMMLGFFWHMLIGLAALFGRGVRR